MLSAIKSDLSQKLRDKEHRHKFFRGRAQDELASDIRYLRQKRGLTQSTLAPLCGMKQSAISRIEQSSYSKWSFNTLLRIAEALDVRVRIRIDSAEDAVNEYEKLEIAEASGNAEFFTGQPIVINIHGDLSKLNWLSEQIPLGTVNVSNPYSQNVTAGIQAFTVPLDWSAHHGTITIPKNDD